ncbi:MAG TPA: hypothetical protein VGM90_41165 [Kofleriaceae bacterium]|jgi:hypothetical protein
MATTTSAPSTNRPRAVTSSNVPDSLDALARCSIDELTAIYRGATVSRSMHAADGALKGRMLTVRSLPGPLSKAVKRWAGSSSFVWEGKTFQASSDTRGVGHNRVAIPRALGRQNLFPFDTLFGESAIDGKPTLLLDYDLDVNPNYIRHVHDEIREVVPGLFLGPAMWKSAIKTPVSDKTLVLFFALDARFS